MVYQPCKPDERPLCGQRRDGSAGGQGRPGYRAVRGRRDTTRSGKAIRASITSRSASSCRTKPARPSRTSSSTRCWISSIEYGRPIRRFPANGIVGHMDVLLEDSSQILSGRDCPGFDFEWPLLEKRGLGLIPSGAAANLDMYGGFFQVATSPKNMLVAGDF